MNLPNVNDILTMILTSLPRIVAGLLQFYLLLLMIRIFLTWITVDQRHPFFRVLGAVTDPWLNLFRGLRLRLGNLDLSPMIPLGIVIVLQGLVARLASWGALSVGIVLSAVVAQLWAIVSGVVFIVGLLSLVRVLAVQFRWGSEAVWQFLDAMLQPLAEGVRRVLRRDAFFPYTFSLTILVALCVVISLAGGLGFGLLAMILENLPF